MEIKELNLFQQLNEEEIGRSLVCSDSQVRIFKKGEYIFRQEEEPKYLYLILEGKVLLGQINFMGKQTSVEYLEEGKCFGETDLFLDRKRYDHFAVAKTRTKILTVSRHFFCQTCAKNCPHHSKIIFNMMHIFAQEADRNSRKLQLLTCGSLRQRIAQYLLWQSGGKNQILLDMNREDLAAYLNTARPSLSRELSALSERGVLRLDGRKIIRILDFGLLQEEADGSLQK